MKILVNAPGTRMHAQVFEAERETLLVKRRNSIQDRATMTKWRAFDAGKEVAVNCFVVSGPEGKWAVPCTMAVVVSAEAA